MVLRPLSHFYLNWELTWDHKTKQYLIEEDSYAEQLNLLICELEQTIPPKSYHDNEDILAEFVRDKLHWPIRKEGNRWICGDYSSLLEQGGFYDFDQDNRSEEHTSEL